MGGVAGEDPDDLLIPSAEISTPDPPSAADPSPSDPPPRPRRPRPRTKRPGIPPWIKFVSMADPLPPDETARSRRGEPRTIKRRAGGFRAR